MSGEFNGRAATVGTSGTGAMGKTPMKIPTVNNPYVLSFHSLRSYKEAKIFNPMLGPRKQNYQDWKRELPRGRSP